jgi:hypothetical protein
VIVALRKMDRLMIKNSQLENSIVDILISGDPCTLHFHLHSHGRKGQKLADLDDLEFSFKHGVLFELHPKDKNHCSEESTKSMGKHTSSTVQMVSRTRNPMK